MARDLSAYLHDVLEACNSIVLCGQVMAIVGRIQQAVNRILLFTPNASALGYAVLQ